VLYVLFVEKEYSLMSYFPHSLINVIISSRSQFSSCGAIQPKRLFLFQPFFLTFRKFGYPVTERLMILINFTLYSLLTCLLLEHIARTVPYNNTMFLTRHLQTTRCLKMAINWVVAPWEPQILQPGP
jgi:hypothetical protein